MKHVRGSAVAVVGGQWGDEGKGKIVDLISPNFDLVARFQGGHNAGHTVKFGDKHFALRLVPSGICRPGLVNVIGNGLVIDPRALLAEIDGLRAAGVTVEDNLKLSDRAHVILPTHALLDGAREKALAGANIGTTSRGIGPTYETKANRTGVRIADLVDPDRFRQAARPLLTHHASVLSHFYGLEAPNVDETLETYVECGRKLARHVTNTSAFLDGRLREGAKLLCEGAQGCMLDVDHGTYPFVTSSSCNAGGAAVGLGIAPKVLSAVVGVMKAYTTRVGSGPFPSELFDATGDRIRERGHEFGTVTGRPRRVGWFDAVVAKTAVRLSGIDALALTKLDVLDEFPEIRIAVGYEIGGKTVTEIPARADLYETAKPVYRSFAGWQAPTAGVESFDRLPARAREYVLALEEIVETRVALLSNGAKREETILRPGTVLDEWLKPSLVG
ncbi:MAG TPA: adenylosuccinate synthase [Thermoanaerobaculia bacterium]|nr:adenylosuccinate synthase [Thermoanaerobaculia bacterium]HQR67805.1 adenylosuccinate synthase [Thermoanaerobaculia bacterium]